MTKYAILHNMLSKRSQAEDEHAWRNALVPAFAASTVTAPAAAPAFIVDAMRQTERDKQIAEILTRLMRRRGVVVTNLAETLPPSAHRQRMAEILSKLGLGNAYNPQLKAIVSTTRNPSILAHEVGHVLQPSMRHIKLTGLVRNLAGIGSVFPAFTSDRDRAAQLAVAGSLIQLPVIGQELSASMRGAQLLRRLGGNPIRAYSGIPSYLSVMGVPWIAKAVRERMGGYRK